MGPHPVQVMTVCSFQRWRDELRERRDAIKAVLPVLRRKASQDVKTRNAVNHLEGQLLCLCDELASINVACAAASISQFRYGVL